MPVPFWGAVETSRGPGAIKGGAFPSVGVGARDGLPRKGVADWSAPAGHSGGIPGPEQGWGHR